MPQTPPTQRASVFDAGRTCPFCQEPIEVGELLVNCPDCGSVHHESCWRHGDGCVSYHCDKSSRRKEQIVPDIIITAAEADKVVPPPKPVKRTPSELARSYMSPKASKLSVFAVVSLVFSVFGFLGLASLLASKPMPWMVVGICLACVGLVLSVIAMVRIHSKKELKGMGYCGTGVMLSALMVLGYFCGLYFTGMKQYRSEYVELKFRESRPSKEELGRMPVQKAATFKANVVISSTTGSFGSYSYGSGIITRVDGNTVYILTNRHVVKDADGDINILFINGEESKAEVAWKGFNGLDAVILSCHAATSADYEAVTVSLGTAAHGEKVFAMGNPMNHAWSYTEGVISGLRHKEPPEGGKTELIIYQTQTPINQGNSGGGLYNLEGILIGLNTWTLNKSVSEGLNFSIATTSLLAYFDEEERGKYFTEIISASEQE